jgi:hypothetical protein
MSDRNVHCRYCLSPIDPAAKKCSRCLEFQDSSKGLKPEAKVEIVRIFGDLIGKLFIPLAVLVIALMYQSEVSRLISRTKSAKFGETSIAFDAPSSLGGAIELHPVSLYYLMGAAKSTSGGWNYEALSTFERDQIQELATKGLANVEVKDRQNKDERDAQIFGRKSMNIVLTPKGIEFLKYIGLERILEARK